MCEFGADASNSIWRFLTHFATRNGNDRERKWKRCRIPLHIWWLILDRSFILYVKIPLEIKRSRTNWVTAPNYFEIIKIKKMNHKNEVWWWGRTGKSSLKLANWTKQKKCFEYLNDFVRWLSYFSVSFASIERKIKTVYLFKRHSISKKITISEQWIWFLVPPPPPTLLSQPKPIRP